MRKELNMNDLSEKARKVYEVSSMGFEQLPDGSYIKVDADHKGEILSLEQIDEMLEIQYEEERKMTSEKELENLKGLIGNEFDEDEIICAFEDFEEEGETEVIVKESENNGYDRIAYINSINSTQFLFTVDENEVIAEIWMA